MEKLTEGEDQCQKTGCNMPNVLRERERERLHSSLTSTACEFDVLNSHLLQNLSDYSSIDLPVKSVLTPFKL